MSSMAAAKSNVPIWSNVLSACGLDPDEWSGFAFGLGLSRLVMLRYFGGLEMTEIAEMLEVSDRTAQRDRLFARTWLRLALGGDEDGE